MGCATRQDSPTWRHGSYTGGGEPRVADRPTHRISPSAISLSTRHRRNNHPRIKPIVQLHLLVIIFAATTILGRLASVSAPVLITWRCLIAAVGAFLWVAAIRNRKIWLGWRQVRNLLLVGGLIGLHWLCLFGAVKIANVSIALAGLATMSLFTAFAEPLFTRRRIRPFEVFIGMIVVLGVCLIAGVERAHALGLFIALLSALFAAVFLVLNRIIVVDGGDPMVMVGWEMAAAAVVCLAAVPVFDPAGLPALVIRDAWDWLWIGILAIICTVFAQDLTNRLLRHITAYDLNLVSNFEPVYGIIAAAIIFGEHQNLRPAFYLGALTIVIANCLHPWLQRRYRDASSR
jgi:drug/metabolite transporter (DMT)-like permease